MNIVHTKRNEHDKHQPNIIVSVVKKMCVMYLMFLAGLQQSYSVLPPVCHYCTILFIEFNITRNKIDIRQNFSTCFSVFSHHFILIDHRCQKCRLTFETKIKRFSRNICLYHKLQDHKPRSYVSITQQKKKIIQKIFSWYFFSSHYYYIWINRMK